MIAQMLEVPLLGVATVLRLERDDAMRGHWSNDQGKQQTTTRSPPSIKTEEVISRLAHVSR